MADMLKDAVGHAQRAQRLLTGEYAVTKVLAESPTLAEAGGRILRALAESLGWQLGMFWEVDDSAQCLRFVDLWHAANVAADEFIIDSRGRTFAPGIGLVGRVWAAGQPMWIPDVVAEPMFRRAAMAARAGLHGAFA
ncbi:MAG TPA: GAF domain-containing protein, partial [Nitrospirales bacterium]|nr:GAF domain-containing protein [Nitrospirales bacterium]